ncbi:MAG: hypothetical protein JNM82_09005 [Rhodocyclaceae bacterium]|nr:hypothetical protein [Rhodocyclaceae bacterium]
MIPGRLLGQALAAHGGLEAWRRVERIEAALSSGGLAFAMHGQGSALLGLRACVHPHRRRVELAGYTGHGRTGHWTPDRVTIRDAGGNALADRDFPRRSFDRLGRLVRWDAPDMLYFAGYALWNYLSFPFLLAEPGVVVAEAPPLPGAGNGRLVVDFPGDFPTHSRRQVFHLDDAGRLLRHDYTADVIGPFATAANLCLAGEAVDGLRFYTRRRVVPRFGDNLLLPGPTLVWIEIDDLRVVTDRAAS